MNDLFSKQFKALLWKNWIILSKHKLLNLLRCVLMPIGFGVFLALAPAFLTMPNNYGIGSPVPIYDFAAQFDGSLTLVWADGTGGTGNPSANAIIEHITSGFNEYQQRAIKQVASPADIPPSCPQNFNLFSECYAGVTFNYLPVSPADTTPINYTISADAGLTYVNVYSHTSDFETRILPLQLAIDQAIIALRAGQSIPTPLEWPYTQETNRQQSTDLRLSYVRGIRNLLVIALFVCFIGIAYHLPESFTGERTSLLTSHMKAMGLLDSARIASWHVSISLAYLPAWTVIALIWHYQIFTKTNGGLVFVVHLLLGLSLASWSFFVAVPFGKSSQLAAVASTLLAAVFAILAQVFSRAGTAAAAMFTLVFPPGYYVFAIRAMCGYENHLMSTNPLRPDPDNHLTLLPILISCIIAIFLWPYLGALLESHLYDAREPSDGLFSRFSRQKREKPPSHPSGVAISIKNLNKTFTTSMLSHEKCPVTAISDLSLNIFRSGIFVLLGSNGAGKSTLLSIVANLMERSSGSITFEGGGRRPPRGALGIVPQKNVLFPDLTCYQTLRVWAAIKYSPHSAVEDDCAQLLRDCDLGKRIHSNADTLSGGQKRKLQLAIGLVGGSKIILVDECTSGVDPLSRRALWKTLNLVKHDRVILYTTHFLDEADLLADHIAILAAPGKLVTEGSPIVLKTNFGQGYSIQVTFDSMNPNERDPTSSSMQILDRVRELVPQCKLSCSSPRHAAYHLRSKDPIMVEKVLRLLDDGAGRYGITSIDLLGTSIEDIFLDLMKSEDQNHALDCTEKSMQSTERAFAPNIPIPLQAVAISASSPLTLTDGRVRPPFSQALTIFHKRMLVARRSWLTPVLCVLIAVCGACVSLVFLSGQDTSCAIASQDETLIPLYWPDSPIGTLYFTPTASILEAPPNITGMLGQSTLSMLSENVLDNATFVSTVQQNYLTIPVGGISIDMQTGEALVAWDATPPPGLAGPTVLNLATNILYNRALNASGDAADTPSIIMANFASFPPVSEASLAELKWVAFFGVAMAIHTAFFSLYVSQERQSSVQAMQSSNGLSDPIGLWLGHLLWDSLSGVVAATIIITIFAAVSSFKFHGLGFFWIVLVQYGIVGSLFSYCVSLFTSSPFISFAAVAGYQTAICALYLMAHLLTYTYAKFSRASEIITTIHFTLSILSPVVGVLRSALVSINFFSLLCDGSNRVTTSSMGDIMRYGGPILYLFVYGFFLFCILILARSPSIIPCCSVKARGHRVRFDEKAANKMSGQDVAKEARAVTQSNDALRAIRITKSYNGNRVVDNVSLGVPEGVIFALLGPNGAGKTTTFNMIRGDVVPDRGDIKIKGISVVNSPQHARLALGVCPQFTAIDDQLTVREHMLIYGRLKGLRRGPELNTNVESLMVATSLHTYADRLASQLSGGNQRKLSLAIALIGNPSVVLIDEFSTGVDAKTKRDMWNTLRHVAVGKAVIITTHSMEEASALANKVGILSRKMLAVGTIEELVARHASTYQVHFTCRTREDVIRAQRLMAHVPGARLADDVATRFEVPISRDGKQGGGGSGMSLADLFHVLAIQGNFEEYTVERATLENVFLSVIGQDDVSERGDTS